MVKLRVSRLYLLKILAFSISIVSIIAIFLSNRSLFLDSLNLARNIAENSFSELAEPLNYEQSAPLLFLYITKAITLLFGISEYSLRLLPLLSGIGCLIFFGKVLKRLLRSEYVIIGVLWLGTHAMFLRYTTEFKQYITDTFISIFLIWLVLKLDKSNTKNLIVIGMIGAISIWLSMPSIFILLGVLGYLFINHSIKNKSTLPIFILSIWFALNFTAEYYLILLPTIHSDLMQNFHQNYFLQGSFWRTESLQHDFGLIVSTIRMVVGKSGLAIGTALLLIIITITSFIKQRNPIGLLFIIPLLSVFGASLIGKYSLIERLMLFTMPLILILILWGIQYAVDNLSTKKSWIRYTGISTIGFALVVGYIQIQGLKYFFKPLEVEDNRSCLVFINEAENHSNTIVCSQFAFPAYTYYTNYDHTYKKLHLGKAIATSYGSNLIETAMKQSSEENNAVWILLGHLQEKEITNLIKEIDKVGTIKNSYRTNRSAAILFSTQ